MSLSLADTVVCGDCLEVLKQVPDESIDSVLTDPPFNISYRYATYKDSLSWEDYFDWQLSVFVESARVLKQKGSILWLNYPETAAIMWARVAAEVPELRPIKWLTWIYHQHTGGKPLRRATRAWLWFSKGEPYIDSAALAGEYRNLDDKRIAARVEEGFKPVDYDWWFYEQVKNVSAEKVNHPCQLPLAMMLRLVEMVTPESGITCDPFCGSGSAPVAAKKLSRHWIGIDSDEKYVRIAQERLRAVSKDLGDAKD